VRAAVETVPEVDKPEPKAETRSGNPPVVKFEPKPKVETGALAAKTEAKTEPDISTEDWCARRHIDRLEGRVPADAASEADLQADNKICATVYRQPTQPY
jgi:hypothetical protein